jgi:hypothetical protein
VDLLFRRLASLFDEGLWSKIGQFQEVKRASYGTLGNDQKITNIIFLGTRRYLCF